MITQISLLPLATGRMAGMRSKATPVRERVERAIEAGHIVELDFAGVDATQSFLDELVGLLVLEHGPSIVRSLKFRNCNDEVKGIVSFVVADRAEQFECQTH